MIAELRRTQRPVTSRRGISHFNIRHHERVASRVAGSASDLKSAGTAGGHARVINSVVDSNNNVNRLQQRDFRLQL